MPPSVSVVVPVRNKADYLPATLASIEALDPDREDEVIVVDGDSDDATPAIAREWGARVVEGPGGSIADGRNRGADVADSEWLAFVDADTRVRPRFLDALVAQAKDRDLAAVSPRCRVTGRRGTAMQVVLDRVFPRLDRPILPAFSLVVDRAVFDAVGGFPDVPNEDTAFSRLLGREYDTGYHPDVFVETSGRRFADDGLSGALYHYLGLDWRRLRASGRRTTGNR
jgi:glycosyltransferase involved in cell wall biosynthesis